MSDAPLNIALVGLGTVGSGVARILLGEADRIARRAGRPIRIRRVAVRHLDRARDCDIDPALLTTDVGEIEADDSIDVVLQLMGGLDPAQEYMTRFLQSGKDVVTANKALLCERGGDLFPLARELGRCIGFEAAVAGGIPIIAAVGQSMAGNQITSLQAILNGTSNFILSEMLSENRPYADALALAQDMGYAEADPTMDIDGTDAAQKLVLLTQLAFGTRASLDQFPRQGIDTLQLLDLQFARELGYAVKLVATTKLRDDRLEMHVQPTLLANDQLLSRVEGAFNMIALEGDAVGRAWFGGPGAGQMPTASAVVADLIDLAVGRGQATFPHLDLWSQSAPREVIAPEEIERRYYLRFNVEDRPHVFADITDVLGRHEISLASVIQHDTATDENGSVANANNEVPIAPLVIMTHRTTEGRIRAAAKELDNLDCLKAPRVCMPVAR